MWLAMLFFLCVVRLAFSNKTYLTGHLLSVCSPVTYITPFKQLFILHQTKQHCLLSPSHMIACTRAMNYSSNKKTRPVDVESFITFSITLIKRYSIRSITGYIFFQWWHWNILTEKVDYIDVFKREFISDQSLNFFYPPKFHPRMFVISGSMLVSVNRGLSCR